MRLPGKIRVSEGHSPVAELLMQPVQSMLDPADLKDDIGQPTVTVGWCGGMTLPTMDKKVPPRYPETAKRARVQGTVDIYGVIAADGHVGKLAVVRSAGAALDKSAAEAITQWTYYSATCGNAAVPMETVISVHYALAQ